MSDKSKTCGTCRFRGEPILIDNEKYEDVESGFFLCDLIKHFAEMHGRVTGLPKQSGAVVIDGSDYYAALCVENEFGCNKWEAK